MNHKKITIKINFFQLKNNLKPVSTALGLVYVYKKGLSVQFGYQWLVVSLKTQTIKSLNYNEVKDRNQHCSEVPDISTLYLHDQGMKTLPTSKWKQGILY
ncbi:hypothetical protein [Fulvivirga sediminis]|uniref:Uncharacterized protein n=1 Tax=Fulvivirga sediminis TaxID=2803949 RepID=A0A937F741_9BACT|nr:hypothetical protein [Fulvivirga sediminis]MBL3655844.1 hypothetical protein [Fulvivirga sediminis]